MGGGEGGGLPTDAPPIPCCVDYESESEATPTQPPLHTMGTAPASSAATDK